MPGALRRAGGSRAAAVLPSRGAFPGRNDAVSEARALTPCPRRGREITMIRRFTRISPDRAQPRDWLACPVKSLSVRSPRPNLHASRFHLDVLHGAAPSVPRSEEHTSELQSLMRISFAVFCLKKKNNMKPTK